MRHAGLVDDARTRLEGMRDDTRDRIGALRAEVDDVIASASSTTGDDEHDPEGPTIGFERAQALGLLAGAQARLAEITAALDRVADGRYGVCVECGAAIGAERLDARPAAAMCLACVSRR